ncbi:MAG: PIN domain-containing protein [Pseudoxanthomonas sp.]
MERYLFDTSAPVALRDTEPGEQRVADLLARADTGELQCHGCFITLMEMLYRVWKDEGEAAARETHAMCLALPLQWQHESPELPERAAALKAQHPLSLADAWIAASALELDATLVHKDPEFENLPGLRELRLPYK